MERFFIGSYYIPDGNKPIDLKVKMPIEWILLDRRDDGKCLLISKDVLDWEMYDDTDDISWDESYIHEYLRELYETWFSDEEKSIIENGKYGSLFLLSKKEIEHYLPDEKQRRAVMYLSYREENDDITISIENYKYWLRKENVCHSDGIPCICGSGNISYAGADSDEIGVRPVMWVDEEIARRITIQKGYNEWHKWWWNN